MIHKKITSKTTIAINNSTPGETIETKVERITTNKEPITDGAPIVFTERKDGILPGYDVRTDRWEVALEAIDKIQKTEAAKRTNTMKSEDKLDAKTKPEDKAPEGKNE